MRECRLMCETPRCARVSVREWLCVPRAPSLTGFPVGSRQPQTGNYHSQHTQAGPPRHPDWLWPRCSRPPGNEWMGGLSARPSAGRTGPAGTCWGQDPGSKMATVIPGPLRCCGPAGGGGGSAGGSRGRVCVWRLGVGPMGCLGGCHRGPGCAGLRVCVTVGLWQEPCPTRCSWRSGECAELRVLFGKGGHVPP